MTTTETADKAVSLRIDAIFERARTEAEVWAAALPAEMSADLRALLSKAFESGYVYAERDRAVR